MIVIIISLIVIFRLFYDAPNIAICDIITDIVVKMERRPIEEISADTIITNPEVGQLIILNTGISPTIQLGVTTVGDLIREVSTASW